MLQLTSVRGKAYQVRHNDFRCVKLGLRIRGLGGIRSDLGVGLLSGNALRTLLANTAGRGVVGSVTTTAAPTTTARAAGEDLVEGTVKIGGHFELFRRGGVARRAEEVWSVGWW